MIVSVVVTSLKAHATSTRYIVHVPVSIYSDAPSEVSWLSLNLAVSLCLTY